MIIPYVHSNYERRPDDHYPTIDDRCIKALVSTWAVFGRVVDPCAPNGSGIVDALQGMGFDASCGVDAFAPLNCDWIVTNPPYARGVVDRIATRVVGAIDRRDAVGVALLMRASWDMAACRQGLFDRSTYRGQTRMRFRPWRSKDRRAQPIHNYVWHVWAEGDGEPVVRYWGR